MDDGDFVIRGQDIAGNVTTVQTGYIVDTVVPTITIVNDVVV